MGLTRKRSRGNAGRPRGAQDPSAVVHGASLGDEVRATRDPEYAAEQRTAKRRRTQEAAAAAAARGGARRKLARRRDAGERGGDGQGDGEGDGEGGPSMEDAAPARLSRKILGEARKQREEVREEALGEVAAHGAGDVRARLLREELGGGGVVKEAGMDSDEESEEGGESDGESEGSGSVEVLPDELTEADRLALAMFGGGEVEEEEEGEGGERVMLADIILAKIREKADENAAAAAAAADPEAAARQEKITEVYGLVGNILARYKSGKIPKAFKVISKLPQWEDLMYLTRPDEWSPAACFAATRLFASNLTGKQAVVFYRDVLLPRVQQDIADNKKLNYHLYRALKKAVYKPDAFNKGIIFPLCGAGGCSLREATIVCSVVSAVSIPMLHSAAALLFIAQQPFSVSNSVFVHTLLNKRYALPYRVVDALVEHFTRMRRDRRALPLCWHVSLLTFARRYKTELELGQKNELKLVMRAQFHDKVTPEIRRELFSARCRGEVMDPDANTIARAIANAA